MKNKSNTDTPTVQQYKRPPILEAVIGITFAQALDDKTLARADARIGKYYPAHEDLHNTSVSVNLNMGEGRKLTAAPTDSTTVHGHKRMSAGMDELTILMPTTITVSQLAPYHGWEHFFARFQRDFHAHMGRLKTRQLSRVGVRYINRVDIPVAGDIVQHEDYLNFFPRVPDTLESLAGYGMQVACVLESIGGFATLRSAPVESPTLGHASFLLDIDVYKTTDLPMNEATLRALLDTMRLEKNRIFESCITARAREEIFGHAKH